jgi:regulator of replication initiation timing
MPIQKTPQLIKIEALARLANQINSIKTQIDFAKNALANGIAPNAQLNIPAITAQEIRDVLSEDTITLLDS